MDAIDVNEPYDHKEYIAKKRIELNWTGRSFKRGDVVRFKGNEKYKPFTSAVWVHFQHLSIDFYIVEHPDGDDRSKWMARKPFADGFESVHSSMLQEGLRYIEIDCSPDFQGETDMLEMVKEKA